MFKTPNEIQIIDTDCNLIMPWYTFPCLDYIKSLDIKDWDVFEWGGGCSTVWYSKNCKSVTTLENDHKWSQEIESYFIEHGINNYSLHTIEVPASANQDHPNKEQYLTYISKLGKTYDLIIIDGSYRNDAIEKSLQHIKPKGMIIFDNFEQDTSGYTSLPNKKLLEQYELTVYVQQNRPYWKTAIWNLAHPSNQTKS